MRMKYKIWNTDNTTGWIYISADDSFKKPDAFAALVKTIAASQNGKITPVGDMQYRITNLPHDLVFQWDDLLGIVVINNRPTEKEEVLHFLADFGVE